MGERVLQIGVDDPAVATAIAAKVGLSGNAAIAVVDQRDAARAEKALAHAGVLVDLKVTSLGSLPFDNEAFDLVVVHGTRGLIASLDAQARGATVAEWHRVLRRGGRVMTIEAGAATGIANVFKTSRTLDAGDTTNSTILALETAGFRPVRLLAEREGLKFAEGIKG